MKFLDEISMCNNEKEKCISIKSKEIQNNFIMFIIQKLQTSENIKNLYKKIIPLIQKIKQLQIKIQKHNNIYEQNKIKDLLTQISKNNDIIQLILSQEILIILTEIINKRP